MTLAVRNQEESEQILAKLTSGIDIKKERARRARWAVFAALAAGAVYGLYRYRGEVEKALFQSELTGQGLQSQGYSPKAINRIMKVEPWVEGYAAQNNLDPDLVNGVIWVESRFQQRVSSRVGARGLMQLMPGTQRFWESEGGIAPGDPFDPRHNIQVGTFGIRHLMDKWHGDVRKVLGSYNWGSGNVKKHPDKFIPKVENYVNLVLGAQRKFARARKAS